MLYFMYRDEDLIAAPAGEMDSVYRATIGALDEEHPTAFADLGRQLGRLMCDDSDYEALHKFDGADGETTRLIYIRPFIDDPDLTHISVNRKREDTLHGVEDIQIDDFVLDPYTQSITHARSFYSDDLDAETWELDDHAGPVLYETHDEEQGYYELRLVYGDTYTIYAPQDHPLPDIPLEGIVVAHAESDIDHEHVEMLANVAARFDDTRAAKMLAAILLPLSNEVTRIEDIVLPIA